MNESHIESNLLANNVRHVLLFPAALVAFAGVCFLVMSDFALPKLSIPTMAFLGNVTLFWIILTTFRYRKIKNLKNEKNMEGNPVRMTVSKTSSVFLVSLIWIGLATANGISREWQISKISMIFAVTALLVAIISGGLLLKRQLRN
ncbi:MAG: hypothetical protein MI725_04690 [Pirellulales bacterium]|nr:hypothetical protein [Pirellulales bacterium]